MNFDPAIDEAEGAGFPPEALADLSVSFGRSHA